MPHVPRGSYVYALNCNVLAIVQYEIQNNFYKRNEPVHRQKYAIEYVHDLWSEGQFVCLQVLLCSALFQVISNRFLI